MTIPANLIHAEVGILLTAIGLQMIQHGLCFEAVLTDGLSYGELSRDLWRALDLEFNGTMSNEWLDQRVKDLLQLTGEEAINFNEVDQ